jgi:hypothetical protein
MGVFIRPNSDVVIGFYDAKNEVCSGAMLTSDGRLILGNWNSQLPIDIDVYHDIKTHDVMFSQMRNGANVDKDKVQRITLNKNPRLKVMQNKLGLTPDKMGERIES